MKIFHGIPVSPGVAMAKVVVLHVEDFSVPKVVVAEENLLREIARFEDALTGTRGDLLKIRKKISKEMGVRHAQIFDAHLLVLEDRTVIQEVIKDVKKQKLCVEYIFSQVMKKYAKVFAEIEDEYLRDRTSDISDVSKRVLKNLMGETKLHDFEDLDEETIVIANDFSPSDTAGMYSKRILAFATDIGGRTSHTAIMAKSLGIPAVVGLKDATLKISNQDYIIVDGRKGLLIVNPSEKTHGKYNIERDKIEASRTRFDDIKELPAETKDGSRVRIMANLEFPEEIPNEQSAMPKRATLPSPDLRGKCESGVKA